MEQSITVTLPPDLRQALDDFVRQEGRSQDDIVSQAVKEHLSRQRSRSFHAGEAGLDAAYREMAAADAREADAHEWAEATLGDAYVCGAVMFGRSFSSRPRAVKSASSGPRSSLVTTIRIGTLTGCRWFR